MRSVAMSVPVHIPIPKQSIPRHQRNSVEGLNPVRIYN
mgnify:FL=1